MKSLRKTLLLTFSIFIFLISCKKNESKNEIDEKTKVKIETIKGDSNKMQTLVKKPRKFKTNERKKYEDKNKENLDVIKIESYYNLDSSYLKLRVPVGDKKFQIHKIKWFEKNGVKGLFVGMSNGKSNTTRGSLGNYLLEEDFKFTEISGTLSLNDRDRSLVIFTYNDIGISTSTFNVDSLINSLELVNGKFVLPKINKDRDDDPIRPEEAGGGVIVVGP